MSIAIISHPDCLLHDTGKGHPERPERVAVIQKALEKFSFASPAQFYKAPLATLDQLLSAHEERYVNWILSIAPKDESIGIDADTIMSPFTLNAALRAAGSVPFAVDLVMKNKARVAFCNVRPPGHHAEYEKAMGFCFFNNVAIGVKHALNQHHLTRIAIIDFDVHHGNGTQNIFQEDDRVMYCSTFEHPFYPGYDEEMDNEHILSIPLAGGTNGDVFRKKIEDFWLARIRAFKPQLIFFSAGFDAHKNDPLADINLVKNDYVWITKQIAQIAHEHCKGRMVSVLEGGYDLNALAECAPAHVNAM